MLLPPLSNYLGGGGAAPPPSSYAYAKSPVTPIKFILGRNALAKTVGQELTVKGQEYSACTFVTN